MDLDSPLEHQSFEDRVARLETSLRHTRRLAAGLVVLLLGLVTAAFVQDDDHIETRKLTLMDGEVPGVSLVAGPESSLLVRDRGGRVIARIGGHPGQFIGEDDD